METYWVLLTKVANRNILEVVPGLMDGNDFFTYKGYNKSSIQVSCIYIGVYGLNSVKKLNSVQVGFDEAGRFADEAGRFFTGCLCR